MNSNSPLFFGANWKMNPIPTGALEADSPYRSTPTAEIVVFATALDIAQCIKAGLTTGAQAANSEDFGAYTGDINMQMLKDAGVTHVLCGHSERRQYHGKTDEEIRLQVEAALQHELKPVLCIGETEIEREAGNTNTVLSRCLEGMPLGQVPVIAYEPIWAIGTGNAATAAQADETQAYIRSQLPNPATRIIYGGSMNATNAAEFLAMPNIDGGLIGGASLRPDEFGKIVRGE